MFEDYVIKEFKGKYQWLSNMAPVQTFIIDGIPYNSVENYYQAQKTLSIGRRLEISKMNPYDSKKWGKALTLRNDWADIKDDVMKKGLEIKFSQPKFYNLLVNTGVSELIEGNYWNDKYWGWCLNTNQGQNKLGKFITEIRTRYFEELDNTPMPIDKYTNIIRELNNIDYKHMDKATIRYLQNDFLINNFDEESLELIDQLFAETTYEEIMNEISSQDFLKGSMLNKIRYSQVASVLVDFVGRFKDALTQLDYTVKIK